jgi:hypothetical protein
MLHTLDAMKDYSNPASITWSLVLLQAMSYSWIKCDLKKVARLAQSNLT